MSTKQQNRPNKSENERKRKPTEKKSDTNKKPRKQLPYFLFVWAAIVAYSRVYLGMHFPGDIIIGAIMGILLALFFGTLAKKVIKKSEATTQDS